MNNHCDAEWFGRKAVFNLEKEDEPEAILCKIYDWRRDNSIIFKKLKEI